MVDVERSKLESGLTLLLLSMVGIALVALFVCAAALLATAEFLYRHLIAAPIAWLHDVRKSTRTPRRRRNNSLMQR
jgi:hypothetical protein